MSKQSNEKQSGGAQATGRKAPTPKHTSSKRFPEHTNESKRTPK